MLGTPSFLGALAREGRGSIPTPPLLYLMKESELTRRILKVLRQHGGLWVKIHGSAYQMAGLPDIIGCYRGRFVGLEVKLPGSKNKLSQRQRLVLSRVSQQGGYSRVLSSEIEAKEALEELDRLLS